MGTTKAVSLRLFSAAILSIMWSDSGQAPGREEGRGVGKRHTAAGLPEKGVEEKESTWKRGRVVSERVSEGVVQEGLGRRQWRRAMGEKLIMMQWSR